MKFKLLLVLVLGIILAGGFYYWFGNFQLYNSFSNKIEDLKKNSFQDVVGEFAKQIFTPPPLVINTKANQSVLTKEKIIAYTNAQRYDNGNLFPLIENAVLSEAARAKAQDMFNKQYFEHISPSGVTPGDLVESFGYQYIVTGENLIMGNFSDEKELVQHWMDSPGHRENILNEKYKEIGVAIIKGNFEGKSVWIGVQEFGLSLSICAKPPDFLKNQIDANKAQLDEIFLRLQQKLSELEATEKKSKEYNQRAQEYNNLVAEYNNLGDETKNLILQYNTEVNGFNACVQGN